MQRDEFEENNEEQKAATVEQSNTWDTVLLLLSTALGGAVEGRATTPHCYSVLLTTNTNEYPVEAVK
jgi:hypothetical protein